jgi:hypothetical protein
MAYNQNGVWAGPQADGNCPACPTILTTNLSRAELAERQCELEIKYDPERRVAYHEASADG